MDLEKLPTMDNTTVFELVSTADGSPTLILRHADGRAEAMHNSFGAHSETIYIYGKAITETFQNHMSPHFFSLGLGLGYNEFLIAEMALKQDSNWYCHSYENQESLRTDLYRFINGEKLAPKTALLYQQIADQFGGSRTIEALKKALSEGRWKIHSEFDFSHPSENLKFHAYLWDAFSRMTDPKLWHPEKMVEFLQKTTAEKSIFSTYACFGDLKRTLKKAGFTVETRSGFGAKREATYALFGF